MHEKLNMMKISVEVPQHLDTQFTTLNSLSHLHNKNISTLESSLVKISSKEEHVTTGKFNKFTLR